MSEMNTFNPVKFSDEENKWLLEFIDLPTVVAMRELRFPVNPKAVKPVLDRVNELKELDKHEGQSWAGTEAIKKAIQVWLRENAKWASDHRKNRRAPRWPSLYSYDGKGRPHLGGPGSDTGEVKTYFGPAGERIPFEIDLIPDQVPAEWVAPGFTEQSTEKFVRVDADSNRIECLVPTQNGICGHTESYKANSRASYNAARARFSKHLRKTTEATELHREAYTNEFGE